MGRDLQNEPDLKDTAEAGANPQLTWIEPVAFDVFQPDGRYLGMVRAPKGFSTRPNPVIRADTVWPVVRGALDVQFVSRFVIGRDHTSR